MSKINILTIFLAITFIVSKTHLETETKTTAINPFPSNRYYIIEAVNSGKCVDVLNFGTANNVKIIQYACHGQVNQRWLLWQWSDNTYSIMSKNSGKVIEASNNNSGTQLTQYTLNFGANQRWRLVDKSSTGRTGEWAFKNVQSGKCMDISNSSNSNGIAVVDWPCNYHANQRFRLILVEDD
jgi:hypothetical protein